MSLPSDGGPVAEAWPVVPSHQARKPGPMVGSAGPRRPRRIVLWLVLTVVALLFVVGGVGVVLVANRVRADRSAVAGPAHVPPIGSQHFQGDLRTLLLPVPPGANAYRGFSPDGTLTAQQFASTNSHPDVEATWLLELGFVRGAVVEWGDTVSHPLMINLLQFSSDSQAITFSDNVAADAKPASGFANAFYWTRGLTDGGFATVVHVSKSDLALAIYSYPSRAQPLDTDAILAIARQQYEQLPG